MSRMVTRSYPRATMHARAACNTCARRAASRIPTRGGIASPSSAPASAHALCERLVFQSNVRYILWDGDPVAQGNGGACPCATMCRFEGYDGEETPVGQTTTLGYPRIGRDRELKRASEAYWARAQGEDALRATSAALPRGALQCAL